MTVQMFDRETLLQQAEKLLHQLSPDRIQSTIAYMVYLKEHSEPEDQLLIASGILPDLIADARQQPPASDWEQELDAL
jgi:hypothetical protein